MPPGDSFGRKAASVVGEVDLRQMFEEVAGEGEIDEAVLDAIKIGDARHNGFHARRQEARETRPSESSAIRRRAATLLMNSP